MHTFDHLNSFKARPKSSVRHVNHNLLETLNLEHDNCKPPFNNFNFFFSPINCVRCPLNHLFLKIVVLLSVLDTFGLGKSNNAQNKPRLLRTTKKIPKLPIFWQGVFLATAKNAHGCISTIYFDGYYLHMTQRAKQGLLFYKNSVHNQTRNKK